ncbi:MAG: ctaD [Bacteriovoracaceae bacterium]|nr:ctaD [Bacteriovoracaceae bacterium]
MGFMAGAHYWFPKFFGKMYNETAAKISWLFIFLGFNVTFMPQFIMGSQGSPRRYYNYLPEFQTLNRISTVGAFMIGFGFVLAAIYFAVALKYGKKAPSNPWRGKTLEWMTSSPPPTENFRTDPIVTGSFYDYRGEKAA